MVSCGREKDGGQVLVGMGIGDQGRVAVEESRVGHYKKCLIPGTTGYYWVILPNTREYLNVRKK